MRVQRRLGHAEEHRHGRCRLATLSEDLGVRVFVLEAVEVLAGQHLRVAGVVDDHLAHHLAHDDLDVLVVDVHTLVAVDLLDFLDQVELHGLGTLDPQDVLRVQRTIRELLTGANVLAGLDANARRRPGSGTRAPRAPRRGSRGGLRGRGSLVRAVARRSGSPAPSSLRLPPLAERARTVPESTCWPSRHEDLDAFRQVVAVAVQLARDHADAPGRSPSRRISTTPSISVMIAPASGYAGFEELRDTRQTGRDLTTGDVDTTGVEGTHRELRTGLTDGLRGDDADGSVHADELTRGGRDAVAQAADAARGAASEGRPHVDAVEAGGDRCASATVTVISWLRSTMTSPVSGLAMSKAA